MRHILLAAAEQGRLFGRPKQRRWNFNSQQAAGFRRCCDDTNCTKCNGSGRIPLEDYPKLPHGSRPKTVEFTRGAIVEPPLPKHDANPSFTEDYASIRIPVERVNPETGETEEFKVRMKKCEVEVTAYGKTFMFRKTNRGLTFYDSREPKKRRSPEFVRDELVRILGPLQGGMAFNSLTIL